MGKAWYEYPIVVPFGAAGFDTNLGGPHDIDLGCPPNLPITALLSGNVSSIDSPLWGMQVGVKLDAPIQGISYCSYLHLSGVNPQLRINSVVHPGDLIGWCGGGYNDAMYLGTSNPTGENFLNDIWNSSRIQAGFALMRGPSYGHVGWERFPPVDRALDPTQIIRDALAKLRADPHILAAKIDQQLMSALADFNALRGVLKV